MPASVRRCHLVRAATIPKVNMPVPRAMALLRFHPRSATAGTVAPPSSLRALDRMNRHPNDGQLRW